MQGEEPTGIQLDPRHGWDRPLPEKLILINFLAQFFLGIVYGLGLYVVNASHPEITQWLAQHLSAVTDPLARLLPVAIYADKLVNPQIYLSAILIRHVFSFLTLLNLVPGVFSFGLCKELAADWRRSLKTTPRVAKNSFYVYLFLAAAACVPLVVAPIIKANLNWPLRFMDAPTYLWGCMAPSFFFFCAPQVIAIAWAYCMTDRKAETEK